MLTEWVSTIFNHSGISVLRFVQLLLLKQVVKVICQKGRIAAAPKTVQLVIRQAALPVCTTCTCFLGYQDHNPTASRSVEPFCTAHGRVSSGMPGHILSPNIVPSHGAIWTRFSRFRPHRSTTYVDAAYCYRPSIVVCLSVGLSVSHSSEPCKNGWTDRDAFGLWTLHGTKKPCIRWGSRSPWGKFEGERGGPL